MAFFLVLLYYKCIGSYFFKTFFLFLKTFESTLELLYIIKGELKSNKHLFLIALKYCFSGTQFVLCIEDSKNQTFEFFIKFSLLSNLRHVVKYIILYKYIFKTYTRNRPVAVSFGTPQHTHLHRTR